MPRADVLAPPRPIASTRRPYARDQLGVATPIAWCPVGAFPWDDATYDWRTDLWWPDTSGGRLLHALGRADRRALTRL